MGSPGESDIPFRSGRAVFLCGAGDARVGRFALREPRPGETLVAVAAVGICGSDLHYYRDGRIGAAAIVEPFVPGHEFGGYLCEDLPDRGLSRGALVAVDPNVACGRCESCRKGWRNLCPEVQFIGAPPFDGAMTQRIWAPAAQIVSRPEAFGPLEAAMLEPLGVAIHAVDLAKPRLLERVATLGAGPIGLLILQALKIAGAAEVHVIEPQAHRRAVALELGATDVAASVDDFLKGAGKGGCPLVVEATNSPDAFREAVACARIGGRIVLAGIPDGDVYKLSASPARRRGLEVKFARRMGDDYPRAIELVRSGRIDVARLVSHEVGLDDAPRMFDALARGEPGLLKILVHPSEGAPL